MLNEYIRCEPDENIAQKKEFTDFKRGLQNTIYVWIGEKKVSHVSIYLRDLQFGPWMGIEEDTTYSAASLLKVAVMFTVLRQEELHPGVLSQRIEMASEMFVPYAQEFVPRTRLEVGKTYTVDELLERMIVHSDNDATNVLHAYLNTMSTEGPLVYHTLEELGFVGQFKTDDSLTVKQSASLFRFLFNSSYLTKGSSVKALQLLARTTFKGGLRAGVPPSVTVAHKFGERLTEDSEQQLHDCGIVYFPQNPYLICIMTRGDNLEKMTEVIAEISKTVYEEVAKRTKQHEAP